MSKSSKFFLAALLGAAAGALLTPVSGKKARAKIKTKAKDLGLDLDKYGSKFNKVVDKGNEILARLSSEQTKKKNKK